MRFLFAIDQRYHGKGPIIYAWNPDSRHVASSGNARVVHIFDRKGTLIEQIVPPATTKVISLQWDAQGKILAILQAAPSHGVLLWDLDTRTVEHVEVLTKDPSLAMWSKQGHQLAIGTGRGEVLMYDYVTKQSWLAAVKHQKRITCGDWSIENKFAFASDDRQITIASANGKTFVQVKVRTKPTNIKFGGSEQNVDNIVSVSMDRKTILLYDMNDPDNALELAFQQRYGYIVSFKWFRDGYVMVGFSLGYLVVISTQMAEIGHEQFCARFHKEALHDITYCLSRHKVATCGDNCIKIVDMKDWKELEVQQLDKNVGPLDKLEWTTDGHCLSVSSRSGCLLVYQITSTGSQGFGLNKSPASIGEELTTGDQTP